ncbi:hypothetical protein Poly24_21920 [Rosistilla carotiformis]|uniref:Sulfatase n=1 Tax=Rosistilla carotiformis TaxID=2528017 RepID=A0A518JSF9_9BACT|nr:DUF1501 domain-containing protein [Rosistilla carotiformis]QDV68483.1 hypothetical protein Poly24_21920 [Rosistilla carotiformis]
MNWYKDAVSRRAMMQLAAWQSFGVSLLSLGGGRLMADDPFAEFSDAAIAAKKAGEAPETAKSAGKRRLIYIFNAGAMSHVDTFDPKPGTDSQGPLGAIPTNIPGVQFGESLPKLAAMADKLAVIRSMTTETGAHGPGSYLMRTGQKEIASTRHPGIGAWMQRFNGRIHPALPPSVNIGGGIGPGYLGAKFAPVPIGDPDRGLQNTTGPDYLADDQFMRRMYLSAALDREFRGKVHMQQVDGYDDLYREAIRLLKSDDLKAFDLNQESDEAKERYGKSKVGRGCLLARRLVENDIQYVEVQTGGWDMHNDIADAMTTRGSELDQALSALIEDLTASGLIEDTTIVVATEFGRNPSINQNAGRDHHPAVFSCAMAGAGVRPGTILGSSDSKGFLVDEYPVSVPDFMATIGKALKLPVDKEIHSPDGRPFTFSNGGVAIDELLA